MFQQGDRVQITGGKYDGRTGSFKKYCSHVFPEYCRVILDLKKRQRVQEVAFLEHKFVTHMKDQKTAPVVPGDIATLMIGYITFHHEPRTILIMGSGVTSIYHRLTPEYQAQTKVFEYDMNLRATLPPEVRCVPMSETYDIVIGVPLIGEHYAQIDTMWNKVDDGGQMVALSGPGWVTGTKAADKNFRKWLEVVEAVTLQIKTPLPLPDGSSVVSYLIAMSRPAVVSAQEAPAEAPAKKAKKVKTDEPGKISLDQFVPPGGLSEHALPVTAEHREAVEEMLAAEQKENTTPEMHAQEHEHLPAVSMSIMLVTPDPKQPRKVYVDADIEELAASVRQHGIIQPLTVRPAGDGIYMIVFGERRYRAAMRAGLAKIPVLIRAMDDLQARELQLIENMQRRDVHPMEEAPGMLELVEASEGKSTKAKMENLGLRLGKSRKYIATRVALNNMLPVFQEMFLAQIFGLKSALEISKRALDVQEALVKAKVPEDWRTKKNFSLNVEYMMRESSKNLAYAPFDKKDATLYPEMGKCSGCPFNTASQPDLFLDGEAREAMCTNAICYGIKKDRSIEAKVQQALTEPDLLLICTDSYLDDDEKHQLEIVRNMGVAVLRDGFQRVYGGHDPNRPEWQQFKEDAWDETELEDFDSPEAYEAEIKKNFDEEMEYWERENVKYVADVAAGRFREALIVAGSGEGNRCTIRLEDKAAKDLMAKGDPAARTDAEIDAINLRVKQSEDKDGEKIWLKIRPLFEKTFPGDHANLPLVQDEEVAMYVAMYLSMDYTTKDRVRKEVLKAEDNYHNNTSLEKAFADLTDDGKRHIIRLFFMDKLLPLTGSHTRSLTNLMAYRVADAWWPEQVILYNIEQEEVAKKRRSNADKRIQALKNKLAKESVTDQETPAQEAVNE